MSERSQTKKDTKYADRIFGNINGMKTFWEEGIRPGEFGNLVGILCPPTYSPCLIKTGQKLFERKR